MSSKMESAIREGIIMARDGLATPSEAARQIAHRYGDLAFTREEVLRLMEKAHKSAQASMQGADTLSVKQILSRHPGESESGNKEKDELLDEFLRQEEAGKNVSEEEWAKRLGRDIAQCDDTPTIKASETNKPSLDKRVSALEQIAHSPVDFEPRFRAIEERLAAIEKRVLADGHSEFCRKGFSSLMQESAPCNCGHDKIRENAK